VFDELFSSSDYPKTIPCEICQEPAEYRFGAVHFKLDFRYGWDPGAGAGFDSARQRDNFLAERNLEKVPDGVYDQPYHEPVKEQ